VKAYNVCSYKTIAGLIIVNWLSVATIGARGSLRPKAHVIGGALHPIS
jgi:hypothetical protein